MKRLPVTLLTGFLGSGKTTLLNALLGQEGFADTLVIINEYGAIPLDHLLVTHRDEALVLPMENGCICCSVRGDLVETLQAAQRGEVAGRFSRIVIETTGLADPVPIVHTLIGHPQLARHYRLDAIVTTVDLVNGGVTLDEHAEAVKQAALADVLVLTKADLAPAGEAGRLMARLEGINPAARRIDFSEGGIAAADILQAGVFSPQGKIADVGAWLQEEAHLARQQAVRLVIGGQGATAQPRAPASRHVHDGKIHAFSFAADEPLDADRFDQWLRMLMDFMGRDVLRLKAILNVRGMAGPVVIHGVQHVFHLPETLPAWPDADRRSRIVCITRGIGQDAVESLFRAVTAGGQPAMP